MYASGGRLEAETLRSERIACMMFVVLCTGLVTADSSATPGTADLQVKASGSEGRLDVLLRCRVISSGTRSSKSPLRWARSLRRITR